MLSPLVRVRVLAPLLCAALFAGAIVRAGDHEDSPLHVAMEGMKRHLKSISQSIADPEQNAATLEHIVAMQRLVLDSKKEQPNNMEDVPEADRAEHENGFQRDLSLVLRELADMEIDVREGRNDDAQARIKSTLVRLRNQAHKKYQKEE